MARKVAKPFTKAQEASLIRSYRLGEVWTLREPREIDGVTFDLRCDVDPDQWRPMASLGTYGHRAALYGPRIAFPWTPTAWKTSLAEGGPVIEASAGSTVSIAKIITDPLRTAFEGFEPPEARERKLAYIWIEAPDGELLLADRPLVLVAEAATALHIRAGDYLAAYNSLVAKMERQAGLQDIETMFGTPMKTWAKPSQTLPLAYAEAFMVLAEAVDHMDEHAYAAFGYMMARAEAEAEILPVATRGLQAKASQESASEARREQSRKATEVLRAHARSIIADNPEISLGACARAVEDRVTSDPTWRFRSGEKWIGGHLKELFELRSGGREYRPRRGPGRE